MHARLDRRSILTGTTALAGLGALALALRSTGFAFGQEGGPVPGTFPVSYSEQEWRKRLTPDQYYILRQQGTEYPGTSPLLNEHRAGIFSCVGCDQPLFDASTKYDSHTGWPSFYQPLPGAVGTLSDTSLGMVRTEVHCANCGGHLGHVFDDGPPPTGLRYCMDGIALKFTPKTA
jgi:peptide-methionine (R)-S-oxide reductase